MAKLRSGILGKASGAIANVVTSSWKGINYARERVIPANPKSAGQTRVRNTLSSIVLIGRAVKTLFINTYWETLVKGTANSGWAKFVGTNQRAIQKLEDFENIKLATGDLEPVATLSVELNTSLDECIFTWEDTVISNGSASDIVYLHAYVQDIQEQQVQELSMFQILLIYWAVFMLILLLKTYQVLYFLPLKG